VQASLFVERNSERINELIAYNTQQPLLEEETFRYSTTI